MDTDPLLNHPVLAAANAKLKRAFENLQTLRTQIEDFRGTEPYSFAVDFDGDWWTATADIKNQPSPDLSVLVGDIAYQCYSAFHHVVWELASRKMGRRKVFEPDLKGHIQLPVATTRHKFRSHPLYTRALVSQPALAVIEGLQPHSELLDASPPDQHPLPIIKEIADSDKHRVLATAFAQLDTTDVAWAYADAAEGLIHEQLLPLGESIQHGTPIARLRFTEGNDVANVRVDPQPALAINFLTDSWAINFEWVEVICKWSLDRMYRFAPLFPTK